ncbi:MAG: hypothetical protein H8F28_12860 [Fibrella sp.]|nr:hypothetical protein [Armatimonadota bacterium]
MEELSPLSGQNNDPSPQPIPPPPLPVLGGAQSNAPFLRQAWAGESATFPMVLSPGRQTWKDSLSDYRTGQVILDAGGCTLTGKAVLPAHIRIPILLVCLLLRGGWLIAYLILEYAIRRDQTDRLTWNDIDVILVESRKKRVCILYRLPEKPKTRHALGLKMKDGYLEDFLRSVRTHAPDKVLESKIGDPTTLTVWIIIGLIVVSVIGLIIWGAVTP